MRRRDRLVALLAGLIGGAIVAAAYLVSWERVGRGA